MENQLNTVPFRLMRIATEQFAIMPHELNPEAKEADVRTTVIFQSIPETLSVYCRVLFEFLQDKSNFIQIEMGCEFEVEKEAFEKMIQNESKSELMLPQGFAAHLAVITVGTARGALHAKTEFTDFNKYFIPTIDLTQIIKGDIPVNLTN